MKYLSGIFARVFDWMDDSLNPIVIKELRQAVQGKFITGILVLFLFFQIATLALSLMGRDAVNNFELGRDTFLYLMGFVLVASTLAVPIYTGYRFASERSDLESDLLFITTITPQTIIRGKFLGGMALAMLFYSASMPYMTITYFFRGIDLVSIFTLVLFSLVGVCLNTGICIFIACLPLNFPLRVVVGLASLMPLFWIFAGSVAMISEFIRMGIGTRLFTLGLWEDLTPWVLFLVFVLGLLYVLSVAAISPSPTNRALGIRRFLTIFWVLSFAVILIYSIRAGSGRPLGVWMIFATALLGGSIPAAVSERTWCGSRVARTIPAGPVGRRLAFFFYSGAAGGLAWATGLIILTQLLPHVVLKLADLGFMSTMGYNFEQDREVVLAMVLYLYGYSLLATLVRRVFLSERIPAAFTWFLVAFLAGLGGALPPILGFIFFGSDNKLWLLANPFLVFESNKWREACLVFALVFSLVVTILNLPWIKRQWNSFRRLEDGPLPVNFSPLPD